MDIVNKGSTFMGKRFITNILLSPYVDSIKINNIYNIAQDLIIDNKWEKINEFLINIKDIERLERKIGLLTIQPIELYSYIESFDHIKNLFTHIIDNFKEINTFKTIIKQNIKMKKEINKIQKYFQKIFNYEKLKCSNLKELSTSFFNEGVYPEIDKIQQELDNGYQIMDKLCIILSNFINDNNTKSQKEVKIQLKHNSNDKYYLYLTKLRGEMLQKILEKQKIQTLEIENNKIKISELKFSYLKDSCKITIPFLKVTLKILIYIIYIYKILF